MSKREAQSTVKTVAPTEHTDLLESLLDAPPESHALEQALEQTQGKPDPWAGYTMLPKGVVKQIRVNRQYITDGIGSNFIVTIDKKETQYKEVHMLGETRMVMTEKTLGSGCRRSTSRSAYVETTGVVMVK